MELTSELELCIPHPQEERRAEAEEIGAVLSAFLRSQSEEKRLVFMRRYWFADSVKEIAARYHISESKIKTMLFRMRGELRTYLESEGIWL
ncbi:MAG: sigma factor-like helix-turn-helix DNA-binding protein [Eubacterium sp.]